MCRGKERKSGPRFLCCGKVFVHSVSGCVHQTSLLVFSILQPFSFPRGTCVAVPSDWEGCRSASCCRVRSRLSCWAPDGDEGSAGPDAWHSLTALRARDFAVASVRRANSVPPACVVALQVFFVYSRGVSLAVSYHMHVVCRQWDSPFSSKERQVLGLAKRHLGGKPDDISIVLASVTK